MQKKGTKFHLSYLDHAVQGFDPFQTLEPHGLNKKDET